MTLVLCAKKQDVSKRQSWCFASKAKKIKNIMKRMNLEKISGIQYIIISECKLSTGFIIPVNSIVLGWESHTFGLIDEHLEKSIKIPTFNSRDEFVYDTFVAVPSSNLLII